ncbi:MAG: hypothetical protein MRECE_12c004 [Mycoplasmataceae bacterium CE_OT135]|nr:MAG: hypothetical protein MRECE_12c004 [Mycoplasmataceae bacterium CE_OT135]
MNEKLNYPLKKKGMRRSQRIIHFATKVTPEFDQLIREQAEKEGLLIVEMLEKYQQAYLEKNGKAKTSQKDKVKG